MRYALLYTLRRTLIGRCEVPTQRRSWPEAVVFAGRVFTKATTGHAHEHYVEVPALFPKHVIMRQYEKGKETSEPIYDPQGFTNPKVSPTRRGRKA
jgi:DNA/RNA endonuclease G (NUC1)